MFLFCIDVFKFEHNYNMLHKCVYYSDVELM